MAKDPQVKKRKASVPEVDAEKTKSKKIKNADTDTVKAPAKKRKATEEAAPAKVKKSKKPKPTTDEPAEEAAPTKVKKSKKPKPTTEEPAEPETTDKDEEEPAVEKKANGTKAPAKSKKGSKEDVVAEARQKRKPAAKASKATKVEAAKSDEQLEAAVEAAVEDEEAESDIDDQTEALLKGFESDGNEEDALNEEGMPKDEPVPERKKLGKAEEKQLKKIAESGASDKPGVVYVGRIPHGFFEHEMRAYFKQFGNILNLRLSRNKQTGNSKHFGWIQFESATVADIVARTMDNYLMFGHLLKVKLVPDEQVHENLFKGANKRFKKVPWNKLEGRKIAQGASEEVWDERVDREEKRREEKAKKLQAIGYEFDAPKVKPAKGVSKNRPAVIEAVESEVLTIEAAPVTENPKPRKQYSKTRNKGTRLFPKGPVESNLNALEANKAQGAEKVQEPEKHTKAGAATEITEVIEEETPAVAIEEVSEPKAKKGKKEKKRKADEIEVPRADEVVEAVETKTKIKKGKKSKAEKAAA